MSSPAIAIMSRKWLLVRWKSTGEIAPHGSAVLTGGILPWFDISKRVDREYGHGRDGEYRMNVFVREEAECAKL